MSLISSKFQLLSAPARVVKREALEAGASSRTLPAKLPRATDILLSEIPRPAGQTSRRPPASAQVNMCIYRYTDKASDLWDLFQSKDDVPLFQVQLAHEAQRSITFQMRDSFNDFLAGARDGDSTMPANVQQLEAAAGVKLVVADRNDPECVGFQQWRVAFYCTDVSNFLRLLDGWFLHKEKQIAKEQPFQVVLHAHTGIDLSGIRDDLSYEHYVINEPAVRLPLHIFEAQPVVGKKITVLNLQLKGDNEFDLVITGHTWPFRARMDAFGIAGGYTEEEGSETRRYYRVWKQIAVASDGAKRFMDMLDTVFKNMALRVTLDAAPVPNTQVAAFVDKLRELPSLFFVSLPEAPAPPGQVPSLSTLPLKA
jgi:hypothetical protein